MINKNQKICIQTFGKRKKRVFAHCIDGWQKVLGEMTKSTWWLCFVSCLDRVGLQLVCACFLLHWNSIGQCFYIVRFEFWILEKPESFEFWILEKPELYKLWRKLYKNSVTWCKDRTQSIKYITRKIIKWILRVFQFLNILSRGYWLLYFNGFENSN